MSSIEATHNKIVGKINTLSDVLTSLQSIVASLRPRISDITTTAPLNCLNLYLNDLQELDADYNLAVVGILEQYYGNNETDDECGDYNRIVISENYIAKIDTFVDKARDAEKTLCRALEGRKGLDFSLGSLQNKIDKVHRELAALDITKIEADLPASNYEICECGVRRDVDTLSSQLKCPSCGRIKKLHGEIFEGSQIYTRNGIRRGKTRTNYNHDRHLKFWLEHIQAKENRTSPKEDLDRIERRLSRDEVDLGPNSKLNCYAMRKVLKSVHLTKYNNNTSYLIKFFTGKSPPQLSFAEGREVSVKFNKIMDYYQEILGDEERNRPYYPYFIYKIISHDMRDKPEKMRLLDYIHLQSEDTIIKNDLLFKQICEMADPEDDLVYKPTERPLYMI